MFAHFTLSLCVCVCVFLILLCSATLLWCTNFINISIIFFNRVSKSKHSGRQNSVSNKKNERYTCKQTQIYRRREEKIARAHTHTYTVCACKGEMVKLLHYIRWISYSFSFFWLRYYYYYYSTFFSAFSLALSLLRLLFLFGISSSRLNVVAWALHSTLQRYTTHLLNIIFYTYMRWYV